MNTRQTILAALGILVVVAIGVWWYFGFTLDFMRFFAAEPGPAQEGPGDVSPSPSANCVPRPTCMNDNPPCAPDLAPGTVLCPPIFNIVACAPASQAVQVGDQANLSASGGSDVYEWFFPEGARIGGVLVGDARAATNTLSVRYDTPGIKKVTVQSSRNVDWPGYVDSVACTVVVEPVGI